MGRVLARLHLKKCYECLFIKQYWIFQFNIFGIFLELKVYVCMTGLDTILRFEKCSLNVHRRLRFSIKKKVIFCTVVDVVKVKKTYSFVHNRRS